jgi:hypothetical protein
VLASVPVLCVCLCACVFKEGLGARAHKANRQSKGAAKSATHAHAPSTAAAAAVDDGGALLRSAMPRPVCRRPWPGTRDDSSNGFRREPGARLCLLVRAARRTPDIDDACILQLNCMLARAAAARQIKARVETASSIQQRPQAAYYSFSGESSRAIVCLGDGRFASL